MTPGMPDPYGGSADHEVAGPGLLASLPNILWQRRWLLLIPAAVIFVAAVAAAFLLPRSYEARATLLVESKNLVDLNDPQARQGDAIDRRMASIRQQILSRPNLVELIQSNDLYDVSRRAEPLSTLVERMRKATDISAVNADIQAAPSGGSGSIAFQLTFTYPQPGPAQTVAQTFVDKLLKLDATQTATDAQTQVNYLTDQQTDLQNQLTQLEGKMRQIAGTNGAALSSANAVMMSGGAGIDYAGQIATLQRENAQLAGQAATATDRDPNVVAAEAALTAAQATYSDNHPDVQIARKRLEIARANAAGLSSKNVSTAVRQQIAANNAAIADLNRQRAGEQSRIATMAAAQARGPAAQQQVQQLQAQSEMLRASLGRVTASLMTAKSLSKLSDSQRGDRLTLIEPPVTPDHPTSPNQLLLIAGGLVGGVAVGLALVLLVELIQRPIRSAAQLAGLLGEPPLAVVPVLHAKPTRHFGWPFRRRAGDRRRAATGAA